MGGGVATDPGTRPLTKRQASKGQQTGKHKARRSHARPSRTTQVQARQAQASKGQARREQPRVLSYREQAGWPLTSYTNFLIFFEKLLFQNPPALV